MAEEIKKQEKQNMEQMTDNKVEGKNENKEKVETKKSAVAKTSKNENLKRDYALVNGLNLGMSPKESAQICNMIRNKNIDDAIQMVEEVISFKRPVRMTALEYPHQHGKGVAGACYPIEACKHFLRLLKNLKANGLHHELELEKVVIFCKADKASRPYRRGGSRFKRTNVMLKLVKKQEKNLNKNNNKSKEAKK